MKRYGVMRLGGARIFYWRRFGMTVQFSKTWSLGVYWISARPMQSKLKLVKGGM